MSWRHEVKPSSSAKGLEEPKICVLDCFGSKQKPLDWAQVIRPKWPFPSWCGAPDFTKLKILTLLPAIKAKITYIKFVFQPQWQKPRLMCCSPAFCYEFYVCSFVFKVSVPGFRWFCCTFSSKLCPNFSLGKIFLLLFTQFWGGKWLLCKGGWRNSTDLQVRPKNSTLLVFPGIPLPANSKWGVNEGTSLLNGGFGGILEVPEPPEELLSFKPKPWTSCSAKKKTTNDGSK